MRAGSAARIEAGSESGRLRALLTLWKPRIGVAIGFTGVAGYALAARQAFDPALAAGLFAGMTVAAGGAGAFNQYVERDLDARMRRTRARPFVTGELHAGPGWLALILAVAVAGIALTAWAAGPWAAAATAAGTFVYAVVYTLWLKRRTHWNIVVGGLAGSLALLAGAGAVSAAAMLSPLVLAFALVLFLWTPSHFWSLAIALREDYRAAGVPMLPVLRGARLTARVVLINTVFLLGASLLPGALGLGAGYAAAAVLAGGFFLWHNLRQLRDPTPAAGRASFLASLVHLGALLGAATLAATGAW